jgi:hypothetical protein
MTPYLFTPSTITVPSFSPILDGSTYNCTITWNVSAQRYYLNCFNMDGQRVFTVPVVESVPSIPINSLSWDINTKTATAVTSYNHNFSIGQEVIMVIEGATPGAYNGTVMCLMTGPNSFRYYIPTDPGTATTFGYANYLISLTAGYFASTLIFRNSVFEVRL